MSHIAPLKLKARHPFVSRNLSRTRLQLSVVRQLHIRQLYRGARDVTSVRSHLMAFVLASAAAGCRSATEVGSDGANGSDGGDSTSSDSHDGGGGSDAVADSDGRSVSNAGADSSGLADSGASEVGGDFGGKEAGSDSGSTEVGNGEGALPGGAMAFPAPNSQGVCPDPPLRITFSAPPTLGTAGMIQVFNAAAPGTAVAALNMGATSFSDTIGGTTFNMLRPAYVDGNDAVIYLKSHALTYGQTYYVTVDSGAIVPPTGTLSITGTTTWRFSTAALAPSDTTALTVALNGSGNFCSVQGAIDAIPANNNAASQILIDSGIYHEIIHFASKNKVTLLGQSRTGTIIE